MNPGVEVADDFGLQAWTAVRKWNPDIQFKEVRFKKAGSSNDIPVLLGTLTITCGSLTYLYDGKGFTDQVVVAFNRWGAEGAGYGRNRYCGLTPDREDNEVFDPDIDKAEVEFVDDFGSRAWTHLKQTSPHEQFKRIAFKKVKTLNTTNFAHVDMATCAYMTYT